MDLGQRLNESTAYLQSRLSAPVGVGLVLGSGLGQVAQGLTEARSIPYGDIPHFPVPTVAGHQGRLVAGRMGGCRVAVLEGRCHYYEGYSLTEVTYPVRVLRRLGCHTLVLTNAAGALNHKLRAGELMAITDHLNFMGVNPLRGPNLDDQGPRFPSLNGIYSPDLLAILRQVAAEQGLELREGVYAAVSGPSYETPAEARFLRLAGADAVGMSTVPEAIVAGQAGLKVLALSCLTNTVAVGHGHTSHDEVVRVAAEAGVKLARLLSAFLQRLPCR